MATVLMKLLEFDSGHRNKSGDKVISANAPKTWREPCVEFCSLEFPWCLVLGIFSFHPTAGSVKKNVAPLPKFAFRPALAAEDAPAPDNLLMKVVTNASENPADIHCFPRA